jgi:hypothetical protein
MMKLLTLSITGKKPHLGLGAVLILTLAVSIVVASSLASAAEIPPVVKALEIRLRDFGKDPTIVKAVKESNKKLLSDGEIKKLDDEWKATKGMSNFIRGFLNNTTARYLQKIQRESKPKGLYSEIFVMNIQGLIVGESNKTSDYWQGDEDKFIKSYDDGKGAVHYGDVEYDESTKAYLVQVSVPVIDPDTGKAIGAITFGVNMSVL